MSQLIFISEAQPVFALRKGRENSYKLQATGLGDAAEWKTER
jgi:hypothetical protein